MRRDRSIVVAANHPIAPEEFLRPWRLIGIPGGLLGPPAGLLWTHRADHAFSHLLRSLLYFSKCRELSNNRFHVLAAFFDVGQFSAAEHQRDLHLVFLLQEPNRLLHLEIDVVLTCLWAQANFFDLGVMRMLVRFLLLFVFVLAVVHDPAYGRAFVRRHP